MLWVSCINQWLAAVRTVIACRLIATELLPMEAPKAPEADSRTCAKDKRCTITSITYFSGSRPREFGSVAKLICYLSGELYVRGDIPADIAHSRLLSNQVVRSSA